MHMAKISIVTQCVLGWYLLFRSVEGLSLYIGVIIPIQQPLGDM